jgi:cobalt-zinc-cadmium efflux system outer membrane protein
MIRFQISGLALMLACLFSSIGLAGAQTAVEDGEFDYFAPDPRIEAFIRETLDANPQLREALARYRAAIQKIPQVTALPDPMLSFTLFARSPETRVGPQTSSLMISQRFPWFGKLDLAGKVATREASAVYEQYRALERKLAAQVKDAFYELAYVDRAVEVTSQEQLLLEHYEELAQTRYATGGGLQQAVIKVQAEITRILNREEMLNQQRESAAARLNTLRSRSPEEPLEPIRLASLMPDQADLALELDTLYRLGEDNRPELRAVLDEIEKGELSVERARKNYWPDLTLSAGMVNVDGRQDPAGILAPPPGNGKNAISFSVGINIPLRRDKYRAGELAAAEGIIAGRDRYQNVLNDMKFEIRDQVNRIETIVRQLNLYEQVLVTQAESALASTESAYETGQLGALDLLDSERVLLDIRLARARLQADYLKALARLELALGTRFPESGEDQTP